jgi:hypothetical protein
MKHLFKPKRLLFIAAFLFSGIYASFGQTVSMKGRITDDTLGKKVSNAVAMAVRLSDSILVKFTRSDSNGYFRMEKLPVDTYQVVFTHPNFGDKTFIIMANKNDSVIDFKNVAMPIKSIQIAEVTILGFTSPVYYKGDTLIYSADSFKVKPNAVVEDLLKKLPGIRVDAQGKIYSQGKKIDQLLVDGDEFFGSDQTIATKNLSAESVESVKVYDKKDESASGGNSDETLKVMDLQLKEDAKKGYFGKVSGGSDFSKFYEGQLLANRFKKKMKLSIFGLASNTPLSQFDWEDQDQYGLMDLNDWEYDANSDQWSGGASSYSKGLPKTLTTGVFYSDKFRNKTKLNVSYVFNPSELISTSNTASQYFFPDTSYRTTELSETRQENNSHRFNMYITQEIDSFLDFEFSTQTKYNYGSNDNTKTSDFFSENDSLTRNTDYNTSIKNNSFSTKNTFSFYKRYRDKKRWLDLVYSNDLSQKEATGILQSKNTYYFASGNPIDSIDQQKENHTNNQTHVARATYNHPFTNKIILNLQYVFTHNSNLQDKKTLDFSNGDYTLVNELLSNQYGIVRNYNQASTSLAYEIKTYRISVGAKEENRSIVNTNKINGNKLKQNVNLILPFATYSYTFKDNSRLYIKYLTTSRLPSINQLQPVPDNTNPNQVYTGNPDLRSAFSHTARLQYSSFKPVTGRNYWMNMNYAYNINDFSNSTTYDSIGRANIRTVNVNGNYRYGAQMSINFPVFSKILSINPSFNFNRTRNLNYINEKENVTINTTTGPDLKLNLVLDKFEFMIGGGYNYSNPSSSLNPESNKPYYSYSYESSAKLTLPKKIEIATNADYLINSQRAQGYNLSYLIWNASVSKTFFKKENLILSFSAIDLLDQNLNLTRSVQDNVITDTMTNAVSRYFLFKATYKFNSNKTSEDETAP